MSAPRYDLVVIGAGPAGSAAALCAARAGLRVALVDKARFPRVKLCGGLVTGRALRALRQPLPADLLERRDSLSFFDRGAPLGQITGGPPVYLIPAFEAGVEVPPGSGLTRICWRRRCRPGRRISPDIPWRALRPVSCSCATAPRCGPR